MRTYAEWQAEWREEWRLRLALCAIDNRGKGVSAELAQRIASATLSGRLRASWTTAEAVDNLEDLGL